MPRQKMRHQRGLYQFPDDFPDCLQRIKEASGLSWSELARRLGTSPLTIRRWRRGVQPSAHYLLALQDLTEELGLAHLLPRAKALHRQLVN
ncbi:MAG: helix-turn-helix transcriptional regulator [Chloroflexota bacterium]|nr:helix-turn-helix transcriptional regulator [Chloroflexota bacterium]MDE2844087.1 helix-turn-helix transcriptional regulator [Chloroflexota bacterium]